ncbi:hypothetical protein CSA56_10545 [candidate division KSB3 bacterium]|uniref:Uncharacterized protein n=1 Tax=candidate division KSB3 bacterium TaxID=2044937 RepID=A0A2G6KDQ0_9BACT|nr:MAG: hypothetical protein CSA56_10545 [candidate division KSB3 bacterium]
MMPSINPYIAGNPVSGEKKFIGRRDVLRHVKQMLHNPHTNAIVLYGQRRIGKTSVLLNIEHALNIQGQYIPVYVDLQGEAAFPLGEILYRIAQSISVLTDIPLPGPEAFDADGIFFRVTFVPAVAKMSGGKQLVFLFDEFDFLDTPWQKHLRTSFLPYLQEWMRIEDTTQFVFGFGRRPDEFSQETLATFKALRSRRISYMDRNDSIRVIRQSEETESLEWEDEAVEWVWYWTQGHPFFTQLLCGEIWELCHDRVEGPPPAVRGDDVEEAIETALERGGNHFQWIWSGLPSNEQLIMAVMAEMTCERMTLDALMHRLHHHNMHPAPGEFEWVLENLERWEIVRPFGKKYGFTIPLMKLWIQYEKPPERVKKESENLTPLTDHLFRAGKGFYHKGKLHHAEQQLQRILRINPDHRKARRLLTQVEAQQNN